MLKYFVIMILSEASAVGRILSDLPYNSPLFGRQAISLFSDAERRFISKEVSYGSKNSKYSRKAQCLPF